MEIVFFQIVIQQDAYEIESLKTEKKRMIIEEGYFTEVDYPFPIIPNFSTLGFFIEISSQGPSISFLTNDSIRDLLGLNPTTFSEV